MPYRLFNGVFAVRCRQPHCPFNDQIKIDQNISGLTEEDVRTEAMKMARDQAIIKHDSIYWRRHAMEKPEVRMVSGKIRRIAGPAPGEAAGAGAAGAGSAGAGSPGAVGSPRSGHHGVEIRTFRKGEVILKKGDAAGTVCEVLEGSAYPAANPSHRYRAGDCFGVAALVPNHTRLSDVVANADDTGVAFYELASLRQFDPARASRLFNRIMEDTLQVVDELGRTVSRLRKGKHRLAS